MVAELRGGRIIHGIPSAGYVFWEALDDVAEWLRYANVDTYNRATIDDPDEVYRRMER